MAATLDEVIDSFVDNADYEESNSVAKARSLITAGTRLMVLLPSSQSDKGSALSFSPADIRAMIDRATAYVNAADQSSSGSSNVRYLGVSEAFRG